MGMMVERERIIRARGPGIATARSRPRVLHLLTSFEIGGTEWQAVELLKRINLQRYDVRLAALRNEGPLYKEVESRFPVVPEFRLTSFYNLNAIRQFARLRALVVRERIDILHAHDFYASLLAIVSAKATGARIVACQRHLKLSDRRVHEWGARIIHRLADRLLVNSEAIRDHVTRAGCVSLDKIVVIRNGLDISRRDVSNDSRRAARGQLCRELGIAVGSKLIIMVANLLPVKGHRFLLDAAARLSDDHPDAHFIIVGDGPLRRELEGQASRLNISTRAHFLGHRADVPWLVSASDLSVLTSLHEGLPNAVMESMAAGVPVIASAVGGCKELIADGETGYLVPPADAGALARRIAFALANEETSAALASRGREFILNKFDMSRMVASTEQLYDELMAV